MTRPQNDFNPKDFRALPYLVCLSLIWIYIGALRSWILPSLSNYLYFAYFPVLSALWLRSRRLAKPGQFGTISLFMFLLCLFQLFHILRGNIDLVSGMYGLVTYETPFIFFLIFMRLTINHQDLKILTNYILFTLPVNLIVVFLQVIERTPALQKVEFTNNALLGTANGVVRATGTFTSSSGFSYYVIFLGLILYIAKRKNLISGPMSICFAIVLGCLTLLSGSRTILLFIGLNLLVILFSQNIKHGEKSHNIGLKLFILATLIGSYRVITTSNNPVIQAFFRRISEASNTENTLQRILNSVLEPLKHFTDWTILGQGLGSYGRGTLGYGSSLWVENDLYKNILECGLVIGGFVICMRFVLVGRLILFLRQYLKTQRGECLATITTFVPLITVGQITNQGSFLLGLGISTGLVMNLIRLQN